MTTHRKESRLPHVPWDAVAGELVTALCFGGWGLFWPLSYWVIWPDLLIGWHVTVIVIDAFALAAALAQRRPASLKVAAVLAAYTGLPSLLNLWHVGNDVHSPAEGLPYALAGIGMLGQVAVLWSCLARLAAPQQGELPPTSRILVQPPE